MILNNLAKAIRRQNYYAVFLEFFIVIAGVVIGFQINAWNEDRQEREREALILSRLAADFAQLERSTLGKLEQFGLFSSAGARIMEAVRNGTPPPPDDRQFKSDLNLALQGTAPTERSATFVELLSNGQMYLIRDEELRRALTAFDEYILQTRTTFQVLTDLNVQYGKAVGTKIVYADDIGADGRVAALAVGSYDFEAMVDDPAFLPSLSMVRRTHAYALSLHGFILDRIRTVQGLLAAEEAS